MIDCPNADVRDLLPAYAHGALGAAERARVESHVAGCADCAAELSLIRAAQRALAPAPAVNVARIVAALPRPAAQGAGVWRPADAEADAPGVASLAARRAMHERARPRRAAWRQVTAVAAVAVGAVGLAVASRGTRPPGPFAGRGDTPAAVARAESGAAGPDSPRAASAFAAEAPAAPVSGALSELSDDALASLLDDIDSFDDAPSAEPAAVVPVLLDEEVGS